MKKYLVILNIGKYCKIPLEIEAVSNADALYKASSWCLSEGFSSSGMEVVELHKEMGIVKVK